MPLVLAERTEDGGIKFSRNAGYQLLYIWSYNPKDHQMRMKYVTVGVRSETPACVCGFDMNDQGIWLAVTCQLWPVPGSMNCATASGNEMVNSV
jgi:hypothetical protein